MAIKNQIIGVMRFSYPATDGFSISQWSQEKIEAYLHDHDRLTQRFRYLEKITLPSLAAQTDPDFKLLILAGDGMPPRFKNQLRALRDTYPFLECKFWPPMGGSGASKRAFRRMVGEGATHVTGFRIDDDDAVAVNYIEQTRGQADRLIAAGMAERPIAVAFTRGIYWDLNSAKQPFHEFREPQPLGLACAMITTAAMETSIYRYNHRRLCCYVPTVTDPSEVMFIRTLHQTNDSGRKIPPHAVGMDLKKGLQHMEKRFGLDVQAALALMPESPL